MAIMKIKPHMIDPLPTEKIPEVFEAKQGYPSLNDRLTKIDAFTVRGHLPLLTDQNVATSGHITMGGGATIPEGQTLNVEGNLVVVGDLTNTGSVIVPEGQTLLVNGDSTFNNPITQVSATPTSGNYGVATVVANASDAEIPASDGEPFTVIQFQPSNQGNYLIYIYFRIEDMPTKINIYLAYGDNGGNKLQTIVDNETYEPGSYNIPAIYINSNSLYPIILNATSGSYKELYISASVVGL